MRSEIHLVMVFALLVGIAPLQAEELNKPQQAKSQVASARIELGAGHPARAVELLLSASELLPEWVVPREWLALAYQQQGEKDKALAEYAWLQRKTYNFDPYGRSNPPESKELIISAEALTMWLINETRRQQDLAFLRCEPQLSVVARGHSLEMATLGYFSHESPTPDLCQSVDRFRNVFNFVPGVLAENIARRWGSSPCLNLENIARTHEDFLGSPGHRANILSADVECMGVGVAANAQGAYWVTEVFARFSTTPPPDGTWNN